MPRQVNKANQIWFEQEDRVTKIGFTQPFLNTLDQCWHILPANLTKFKANSPLLTVETNDALISILSPVAGSFMQFSDKAQNFPDKLKADDVVMELRDGPPIQRAEEAPQAQEVRPDEGLMHRFGGTVGGGVPPRRNTIQPLEWGNDVQAAPPIDPRIGRAEEQRIRTMEQIVAEQRRNRGGV